MPPWPPAKSQCTLPCPGCYTLSFTFLLVEYGMQHTQLVLVLQAERRAEQVRDRHPLPELRAQGRRQHLSTPETVPHPAQGAQGLPVRG